jgi:alkylation response protein AidB-like acyl-CoA dehydrogenase
MFFAAVHFSAVATGLARRAVDALVELAPTKTPLGTGRLLRDQHQVQEALGRAEARLESARVYRAAVVADAWTATMAGERASLPMLMGMRLAGTNAVEAAVDVVTAMFRAAGTTAILEASPLGAAFRDVHVIAQNFTVQPRNYEGAGRLSLGLDVSVTGW